MGNEVWPARSELTPLSGGGDCLWFDERPPARKWYMAAVVLYAEFTAKSGQEERVDELISGLTDDVRAEPGNSEFTVYRERDEPRRFFVFERYADEEAFQAHIGADYGAVFNAALGDLIEEDGSQLTFLSPTEKATL